MDLSRAQFVVKGPYRHSDGSFKFDITIFLQSPITGAVDKIVGSAAIHVDTDKACEAMGRALIEVAKQLPAEVVVGS
jgi:hypothetical protein